MDGSDMSYIIFLLLALIVSELILSVSFLPLFLSSKKNKMSFVIHFLFFIIGGAPVLYAVIDQLINDHSANIGLGLTFMYTWSYTAIVFITGIIVFFIKKEKSWNDIYVCWESDSNFSWMKNFHLLKKNWQRLLVWNLIDPFKMRKQVSSLNPQQLTVLANIIIVFQ